MRVISGISKGHKLKSPKGLSTRPTEDKIKESVFNILGTINREAKILDLFAGSGSIGIEFLSRGAKECYFIDNSQESISTIKENLNHTKLGDKAKVFKGDALKILDYFNKNNLKFSYIYLDPPFKNHKLLLNVVQSIVKKDILENGGLLILEHENNLLLDDELLSLIKEDKRKYGSKSITFYKENL